MVQLTGVGQAANHFEKPNCLRGYSYMIPDNREFAEFFESISLKDPKSEEYTKILIPVEPFGGETKPGEAEMFSSDPIWLWFKHNGVIKLESVIDKLIYLLKKKKHPANPNVCLAILSIYSLHPDRATRPVDLINNLLEQIFPCDLTQYIFTSLPYKRENNYKMSPFKIGVLDKEQLKYQCKKVPSDYYERYGMDLGSSLSITRNPVKVNLIALKSYLAEIQARKTDPDDFYWNVFNKYRWVYFSYISELMWIDFLNEWDEKQHILTALGGSYVSMSTLLSYFKESVSIYRNLGPDPEGFVFPKRQSGFFIDYGKAYEEIPKIINSLKDKYGITEFLDSEIHQTIKSYSRFLCMGINEWHVGRLNEAFLNFTIGIEIVLGEKIETTKKICQRIATITCGRRPEEFKEKERGAEVLYDARSRYVHNGKNISAEQLKKLDHVCQVILKLLLNLQTKSTNTDDGFLKRWHDSLDFLASGLKAKKILPVEDFVECGIVEHLRGESEE